MKPLIVVYSLLMMLFCCSCGSGHPDRRITEEKAYEGVSNYCHQTYDWSIAQENPSIMYVDKKTGNTRIVEKVPVLNIENETGTIDLLDYLEKKEKLESK